MKYVDAAPLWRQRRGIDPDSHYSHCYENSSLTALCGHRRTPSDPLRRNQPRCPICTMQQSLYSNSVIRRQ